jgi:hypothetical protein
MSWWEWSPFSLTMHLVVAPAVVAAVYLVFRERGP